MRMPNNADDFWHALHLSIDIAKNDNDILDSLAKLLPIWRKELKISEPEKKELGHILEIELLAIGLSL